MMISSAPQTRDLSSRAAFCAIRQESRCESRDPLFVPRCNVTSLALAYHQISPAPEERKTVAQRVSAGNQISAKRLPLAVFGDPVRIAVKKNASLASVSDAASLGESAL